MKIDITSVVIGFVAGYAASMFLSQSSANVAYADRDPQRVENWRQYYWGGLSGYK